MKDVGIVGMPYSGKTTLFTALTRTGAVGRANQAVVDVPDPRVGVLAELERSKKIVHAKVRFIDVPGGLTAQGIGEYRQTDALCMVVRGFGPDASPSSELSELHADMIVADLTSIENGLERVRKRARGSSEARAELEVLERAQQALESETPVRDALDPQSAALLRGYGLLTAKPWIVAVNVAEESGRVASDRPNMAASVPLDAVTISAALEAEVAGMDAAEAAELLTGFGVTEPGLHKVIRACYQALDLITFLTTGEDETRAWEVRRGATAPEAAGVIHSDLQRGFIRAEVMGYDDLVGAGSWDAAKAKGLLRVEGKDYLVQEGDIVHVRFAV